MTSILQAMGYIQDQADAGQKKGLARLLGSAYGAAPEQRQQILGAVAQRGGADMAFEADKHFAGMDDTARKRLGQDASALLALPADQRAQAYPGFAAKAQQLGIPAPMQWSDSYADGLGQLATAFGGAGLSSELQTFNAMSRGLTPDQIAEARQINLGLKPRAVTGAMKFDTWTDASGNPRPQRNNPTTGQVEVYVDEKGQWVPLGGGVGQSAPAATKVEIAGVPKDEQDRISRVATAMEQAGYSADDINAFVASRLPGGQVTQQPGLGVGRTKEAEAYAVDSAKNQAQIDALPTIGGLEATNAGRKEMAVAAAQTATGAGVEAAKQFGQDAAKTFGAIQDSGRAAAKERSRLALLRADLKNTYTGPGANMLLGIKRAANAFGIKVDGLAEGEAARALSNQLALSLRNPAGGEGMPGAMSDADRNFLMQSVPGLLNSPQGWRAMVDMRLALADSAVKQAQYAEQLRRQGVPIQDIPGRVQDFANQNQIFNAGQQSAPSAPAAGGNRTLRYNPQTGKIE